MPSASHTETLVYFVCHGYSAREEQRGRARKVSASPRQRVDELDDEGVLPAQDDEALGGDPEEVAAVAEASEPHVDALAGGDVQEGPPVSDAGDPRYHDPPPGVEPAVEDVVLAGLRGGRAPCSAHRAEADVVGVSAMSLERTRSTISPVGPALRSFA
jgi:hypothetical protein